MYFYNSSAVYEGDWSEDHQSGWGRMYYESGDIYEGEWMKDKHHGQGIIRYSKGTLLYLYIFFKFKIYFNLVWQAGEFYNLTLQLMYKQMEIGMKAPGETAIRTEMENCTILTKASFMKAFGWME